MFRSYCYTAWRNLMKDRRFTFLNLIGLSTGLACALLIYLWVNDELHIDKFHKNDAQLYQVMENRVQASGIWTSPSSPIPMADALAKDMPEVEYAVNTTAEGDVTLSFNNEKNIRAEGRYASRDFFKIFSYRLILGNADQVLTGSKTIVLTDELAIKLFGSTSNAMGKTVMMMHKQPYTVAGVFEAPGTNSSNRFDFVAPIMDYSEARNNTDNWGATFCRTYLLLKPGTNINRFNARIANYIKLKTKDEIAYRTPFITHYSDRYLYGRYSNGVQVGGRIDYVHLFSLIALFILAVACINFMNLSTAKAGSRAKEVGIKKAIGAGRGMLILQYLSESVMMAFISLLFAVILVALFLPAFNAITSKQLSLQIASGIIVPVLLITLLTGLLAGSYPALYLSGFKPITALKGRLTGSLGELLARKGLVIFQFTVSIVLIVAVLVIQKQINFIQQKNLGYTRDQIITFYKEGALEDQQQQEAFLTQVRNIPGVKSASDIAHSLTGHSSGTSGVYWEGKAPGDRTEFEQVPVDFDMLETLDVKLKDGRSFSRSYGADSSKVIFNEAAIRFMGLKDPIGKRVQVQGANMEIVGVVRDFNFQSLYEKVKPLFFVLAPDRTYRFMIKTEVGMERRVVAQLRLLYQQLNPGFSFDYQFLDDNYRESYTAENQISALSRYFAGLAILISCLGLFGLATFTAQRRNKEIGIRKVLGATVGTIVIMLTKDFIKLVIAAIAISIPLAWWATVQWLKGFAYSAQVGVGIYIIAGASTVLLALLTISFQSVKAALTNPVKSLKAE
ncbi:ABC transporter permease [Chitinophaga sp. 212800010-3]|uniref:ABC transporter permease n=1 Tax=unclassified Chitinophaga TaxID=2619133 RepID=UPI002DEC3517|nr:ABC transporter permease [Chitinophaga sp. 212800010-3]